MQREERGVHSGVPRFKGASGCRAGLRGVQWQEQKAGLTEGCVKGVHGAAEGPTGSAAHDALLAVLGLADDHRLSPRRAAGPRAESRTRAGRCGPAGPPPSSSWAAVPRPPLSGRLLVAATAAAAAASSAVTRPPPPSRRPGSPPARAGLPRRPRRLPPGHGACEGRPRHRGEPSGPTPRGASPSRRHGAARPGRDIPPPPPTAITAPR